MTRRRLEEARQTGPIETSGSFLIHQRYGEKVTHRQTTAVPAYDCKERPRKEPYRCSFYRHGVSYRRLFRVSAVSACHPRANDVVLSSPPITSFDQHHDTTRPPRAHVLHQVFGVTVRGEFR